MITFAAVLARIPGLDEPRVRFWIAQQWVRPVQRSGEALFEDIDLARLRLLRDLEQLDIGEDAMPVVLSLLDQLYESRRHLRRLIAALDPATLDELARRLTRP